jgi:hypothetical protein
VRRAFWLAVGLGAGATVVILAKRWARQKTQQLAPANIANQAAGVFSDIGKLLKEAAGEFRAGASEKEAEIRASLGE